MTNGKAGPGWYVEVWSSKRPLRGERFRLRIVSGGNGERLAQGEGYHRKEDALHTAHLIADPAKADVRDSTA
jgi:uncharacterized protein YegP (UPF0339 family)